MKVIGGVLTLLLLILFFVDIEAFGRKVRKWQDSMK